jgi:hypothetical protein
MELASNHSFPRHTHDEFGIGVVLSGAQRSWSGVGQVESLPGDVITVNPGELHDGTPINGTIRRWRIIYFDPQVLAQGFRSETAREIEGSPGSEVSLERRAHGRCRIARRFCGPEPHDPCLRPAVRHYTRPIYRSSPVKASCPRAISFKTRRSAVSQAPMTARNL